VDALPDGVFLSSLLFRLFGNFRILLGWLGVRRHGSDVRCTRSARCQFRSLVLWRADVTAHVVLSYAVHHHLHRLSIIFRVDPDRLVQITFFLLSLWSSTPFRRVVLVFRIRRPQRDRQRSNPLEFLDFLRSNSNSCAPRAAPKPPIPRASWRWNRSSHRAWNSNSLPGPRGSGDLVLRVFQLLLWSSILAWSSFRRLFSVVVLLVAAAFAAG